MGRARINYEKTAFDVAIVLSQRYSDEVHSIKSIGAYIDQVYARIEDSRVCAIVHTFAA